MIIDDMPSASLINDDGPSTSSTIMPPIITEKEDLFGSVFGVQCLNPPRSSSFTLKVR